MLIVAGEIRMQAGTRDQFLPLTGPLVAATRLEQGCRSYAFTPDPDDPDLVRLFELWDDEAALTAHFSAPHVAEWRAVQATLPIESAELFKYTVADASRLG